MIPTHYKKRKGGRWIAISVFQATQIPSLELSYLEEHKTKATQFERDTIMVEGIGLNVYALRFPHYNPRTGQLTKGQAQVWDIDKGMRKQPIGYWTVGKKRKPGGQAIQRLAQIRNFNLRRLKGAMSFLRQWGTGAQLDSIETTVERLIVEKYKKEKANVPV